MDAHFLKLSCNLCAHLIYQVIILYCAKSHLVGKFHRAIQPHAKSPFSIKGYHERYFGQALIMIGQPGLPYRVTL